MDFKDLLPLGIIFIVLGFVFSIGSTIVEDVHSDACDYTWVTTADILENSSGVNPVTSGKWGCCEAVNASDANDCDTWRTSDYSINASQYGSEAIDEGASWMPTIAQVIVAAIIIGILISALYVQFKGGI